MFDLVSYIRGRKVVYQSIYWVVDFFFICKFKFAISFYERLFQYIRLKGIKIWLDLLFLLCCDIPSRFSRVHKYWRRDSWFQYLRKFELALAQIESNHNMKLLMIVIIGRSVELQTWKYAFAIFKVYFLISLDTYL